MNTRKWLAIAALGMFLGGVIADQADARAGRSGRFGGGSIYRSMGDRGARTNDNSGFKSIERTRSGQWNSPWSKPQSAMNNRGSWFQRNPFMAGLAGALAGSALFSMLGHGFGFGGGGGGLLTLLLLGGLAFLAFRMFKNRPQVGYADGPQGTHDPMRFGASAPTVTDIGGYRQNREQGLAAMALNAPGFTAEKTEDELSGIFFRVQEAWSANDRSGLRGLTTDEMFDYFAEDLDAMASRGERNVIKNIVMRSFEISEAWQEEAREFITVKIYARLIDYVERHGSIIEGSESDPVEFKEAWTYIRHRGDQAWKLSAINQY